MSFANRQAIRELFYELLRHYEEAEGRVIGEYSTNIEEDNEHLLVKVRNLRDKFEMLLTDKRPMTAED